MFISIDYLPNEKFNRKLSKGINVSNISTFEERHVYQGNEHVAVTKVIMANGEIFHVPFTYIEFQAIISKCAFVHDFQIGTGDYYVQVLQYEQPPKENPPTL